MIKQHSLFLLSFLIIFNAAFCMPGLLAKPEELGVGNPGESRVVQNLQAQLKKATADNRWRETRVQADSRLYEEDRARLQCYVGTLVTACAGLSSLLLAQFFQQQG